MNRFIATATFVAMLSLAAAPAFAATDTSLSTDDAKSLCTKLASQFDSLKPFKEGLPYWRKASEEFKTGRQDCNNGQTVAGAEAMQSAISNMYVEPDTL